MGLIDNTRRIVREDYDSEYHNIITKLAFTLNTFMEQTVRQVNGNLGPENFRSDIITAKITVDSNGTPVGNDLIRSGVSRPIGITVLNATNKTDIGTFPTGQPFISFTINTDTRIIRVLNITGLQANNEYELVLKVESN